MAGPEATNNASAAGGLVPMLTLGIPTTATAAVMLAAIQSYGIEPGPQLFENEPELVWGLIASLFIGNTVLLVLNLPLAPLWAKLLRIPRSYLYAGILFFSSLGAYAANANTFDLFLLLVIGALGLHDAPLRAADPAGDHRGDPRPVRRGEAPPGAADQQRRPQRPVRTDLDRRLLPSSDSILLWPMVRRFLPRKAVPERPEPRRRTRSRSPTTSTGSPAPCRWSATSRPRAPRRIVPLPIGPTTARQGIPASRDR